MRSINKSSTALTVKLAEATFARMVAVAGNESWPAFGLLNCTTRFEVVTGSRVTTAVNPGPPSMSRLVERENVRRGILASITVMLAEPEVNPAALATMLAV